MTDGTGTSTGTSTSTGGEAELDAWVLAEGGCVTVVAGADEADVIRCFGGGPDTGGEDLSAPSGRPTIAVSTVGRAVVVVERDGWEGLREEVLRPLSRLGDGRAVSVRRTEDTGAELALAEGGFVLSSFTTAAPERRHGKRPEAWDAYVDGAPGPGIESALGAVARATGVRLDAIGAPDRRRVLAIEPVPEAVLPQELEDSPLLGEEPFAQYLADPRPGMTAAMERDAVEVVAAHHGIAKEPLCTLALAVLDGCGPPEGREGLRAELAAAYAAERSGQPGRPSPRADVWQALGDLLAHDAGAGTPVGTPPMMLLARAMTDADATEEARRFRLLRALHTAVERAGERAAGRGTGAGLRSD